MTAYRHVIFRITIVAFLAAFLPFIPGCLLDEDDSRGVLIIRGGDKGRLPPGYRAVESEGRDDKTKLWKEIVHEKSGIVLRLVPAGEFDMGSPDNEEGSWENEWPAHRVKISEPFYIGKYEVTNEQYCKFLNAKQQHGDGGKIWLGLDGKHSKYCRIEKCEGEYRPKNGYAGHPVIKVSWWGAKAFCAWAGVRLTSEAEWEYACRAGSKTRWCFGDDESVLGEYAWYKKNSGNKVHEVGTKKPNAWGIYDMHGNVGEWCEDVGHRNYNDAPCDGSAWTTGGFQCLRTARDCSCGSDAQEIRAARRAMGAPGIMADAIGFRVVVAGTVRGKEKGLKLPPLDKVLDEMELETGNPELDKALDDMKFENAPTLGPIARRYFVAIFKGEWEKVWDMQSSETHKNYEKRWEAAKSKDFGADMQMANQAGSAKEFYVLRMLEIERSEEQWVKRIAKDEEKFEVTGEEFSEDGKTGWIKARYLKTGVEEKIFNLVKEGDEWKIG